MHLSSGGALTQPACKGRLLDVLTYLYHAL